LKVNDSDTVLIVYDESVAQYLSALVNATTRLKNYPTFVFFPIEHQHKIADGKHVSSKKKGKSSAIVQLPRLLNVAISSSSVILNLVNGSKETTPVRSALIGARITTCKFAHMPGLDDEILDVIQHTNFDEIARNAELLGWALGQARNGNLITYDKDRNPYELKMDLEGWANEPLMSNGTIEPGSWANALPGETFFCPRQQTVNGEIVISGSVPGIAFSKGEEVILKFNKGRLIAWASPSRALTAYFDKLQSDAKNEKDVGWNVFAELGIGLNSKIKRLNGNPLYDEKMYGTIHIALGDNTRFGHSNESRIHVDMVVRKPDLILDDKIIIKSGNLQKNVIHKWKEHIFKVSKLPENCNNLQADFSKVKIEDDIIFRQTKSGGREGKIAILKSSNTPWCEMLRKIAKEENQTKLDIHKLLNTSETESDKKKIHQLLGYLMNYGVIFKDE
jgi:hypothetical protein